MSNTPDTPWSCQVSVRWEFASDGSPAEDVRQVPFGPRFTDKANVELMLRRAQSAVLNPQCDSQEFVRGPSEALSSLGANMLSYSRNVVCVELSGPELPDLTFIDLPGKYVSLSIILSHSYICCGSGIVQNAPSETVKLVEDLVLSHISGNCIILWVVPMDGTESLFLVPPQAVKLAKQVDPLGARTIGKRILRKLHDTRT